MKERPILFSGEMVRAILDGRKTQTRRILKIRGIDCTMHKVTSPEEEIVQFDDGTFHYLSTAALSGPYPCPYGAPGDRLWVRETHRPIFGQSGGLIAVDYQADPREKWERLGDQIGAPEKWKPSIHMRREYSRILLEITDVRAERLNDISEEDAIAEGIQRYTGMLRRVRHLNPLTGEPNFNFAAEAYAHLWEHLNGSGSWEANPWVWAISFKVLEKGMSCG